MDVGVAGSTPKSVRMFTPDISDYLCLPLAGQVSHDPAIRTQQKAVIRANRAKRRLERLEQQRQCVKAAAGGS